MILCTSCKHDDNCTEVRLTQMWGMCEYYSPRTNADRLRAGSDEKIAGVMSSGCPPGLETLEHCAVDGGCYDCWLDWLSQPAEGGGEDA